MTTAKKRIPGQSIRNTWQINPRTRVHDNDIRKNKKKFRQLAKKELQNEIKQNQKTSPSKDWFNFHLTETRLNQVVLLNRIKIRQPTTKATDTKGMFERNNRAR